MDDRERECGRDRGVGGIAPGREDRFANSHRMMAAALSPEDVRVIPGGHEWPVWAQLWGDFLDRQFSHDERSLQPNAALSNG